MELYSAFLHPRQMAEFVLLAAVLFVGIYVSYTDVLHRRIPNRFTLGLLAFGLGGQFFFLYSGYVDLTQIGSLFFGAFAVGYFLCVSGLWAPGDAKLFWACAVAMPPTLFPSLSLSSLNSPVWALLVNALLASGLVILFSLAFFKRPDIPFRPIEEHIGLLRRGLEMAGATGLILGLAMLLPQEKSFSIVEAIALVVFLYRMIDHFAPAQKRLVLVAPGLGVLAFLGQSTAALGDCVLIWLLSWLAESGYVFLRQRYAHVFIQLYPISALQEGLTPRESIYLLRVDEGGRVRYIRSLNREEEGEPLCKVGQPLSKTQAGLLRSLSRSGAFVEFDDEIVVSKDIPYAPFLLVAVCLTAFSSGTIFSFADDRWGDAIFGWAEPLIGKLLQPLL